MSNKEFNNYHDDEEDEDFEFSGSGPIDPDSENVQITPEHILLSIKYSIDNLKTIQKFCLLLYNGFIQATHKYEEISDDNTEKATEIKALIKELKSSYSEIARLQALLESNKKEKEENKEKENNELCRSEETI